MISDAELTNLLLEGGDHRTLPDAAGRNSYGGPIAPISNLLALGTCTASAPDSRWWSDALAEGTALLRLDAVSIASAWETLRTDLIHWIGAPTDVAFAGLGTDAEYLATMLALDGGRLTHVMVGVDEAGRGTEFAAAGRHFTPTPPWGGPASVGEPLEGFPADRIEIRTVPVRDERGRPRLSRDIDAAAAQEVRTALQVGSRVLLHVMATSKTGLHGLAAAAAPRLGEFKGEVRVTVLVDAAQGRLAPEHIRWCLQQGWFVLFTASKFYGAPPFAGALFAPPGRGPNPIGQAGPPVGLGQYIGRDLLPPSWSHLRAELPDRCERGLLLRWRIGWWMIKAWWALSPGQRSGLSHGFAHAFDGMTQCPGIRPVAPSPRTGPIGFGIGSFRVLGSGGLPLDMNALRRVHRVLASEGILLGQPVALPNRPPILRVALGVPWALRMLDNATAVDPHGEVWLAKQLAVVAARIATAADER